MLREEGGYEYKKAIVNTIISIVEENPEAKESGRIHYRFIFIEKTQRQTFRFSIFM